MTYRLRRFELRLLKCHSSLDQEMINESITIVPVTVFIGKTMCELLWCAIMAQRATDITKRFVSYSNWSVIFVERIYTTESFTVMVFSEYSFNMLLSGWISTYNDESRLHFVKNSSNIVQIDCIYGGIEKLNGFDCRLISEQ